MKSKLKRLLAAFVDFYICCFLGSNIVYIVTLGKMNVTFVSVTIYIISTIILVILKDAVLKNASVGKRIFKLKIAKIDGTKLMLRDVIKRNLPIVFLLPIETILLVIDNRRIGDIWIGTSIE